MVWVFLYLFYCNESFSFFCLYSKISKLIKPEYQEDSSYYIRQKSKIVNKVVSLFIFLYIYFVFYLSILFFHYPEG
ncbi:hypothetical protein GW17_00041416 [Ensete ventricosum]|nr:hypothetical protein GW17_00041416 [Ensete ventricosum]